MMIVPQCKSCSSSRDFYVADASCAPPGRTGPVSSAPATEPAIWPADAPRAPDLDLGYLVRRFELAGALIRNIALAAAFLAAAEGQPIAQRHVLHAAHREYQKLGKMVDKTAFGR